MNRILSVIAAVAALLLSGCGKDRDGSDFNRSDITGTWEVVGYRYMEDGELETDDQGEDVIIVFAKDGTIRGTDMTESAKITWKIKGNKLLLRAEFEGESDSIEMTIVELTSERMILRYTIDKNNWEEIICSKL